MPRTQIAAEHPLLAWAIENGCIITLAVLRLRMSPPWLIRRCRKSFILSTLLAMAGGVVLIDGAVIMQHILVHHVYRRVPFFSAASRKRSLETPRHEIASDWSAANLPVHTVGACLFGLLITQLHERQFEAALRLGNQPFKIGAFLLKLGAQRVVADMVFYAVHKALHTTPLYRLLHKRHHEHNATALPTNYHFGVVDLLLEGFLPLFSAHRLMDAVGVPFSPLERFLSIAYIQWYEVGSHSGKPMPTVTYFPPLAPLYRLVLGNIDEHNVAFHQAHHRFGRGNYGITQWMDYALGTALPHSKLDRGMQADDEDDAEPPSARLRC